MTQNNNKKINRENITLHLIEYQLEMVGKTLKDIEDVPYWYNEITMSKEQHEEFKKYAIPLLKKTFKFNNNRAKETFCWFDLNYGLKIQEK